MMSKYFCIKYLFLSIKEAKIFVVYKYATFFASFMYHLYHKNDTSKNAKKAIIFCKKKVMLTN